MSALTTGMLVLGSVVVATRAPAQDLEAGRAGGPDYPEARRGDTVEVLHGAEVADPYRWMEEQDSEELDRWLDAQVALASGWFARVPGRDAIRSRLEEVWNYERVSAPVRRGDWSVFARNSGLQNQSVLYRQKVSEDGAAAGEPEVVLDPNTFSEDGTVALSGWRLSDDGRYLAYGTSGAGSDWQSWRVREVASGEDLPDDRIGWVKFSSAAWRPDSSGFCYSRYDEPAEGDEFKGANYFHKVYFHRLGTPQSEDVLVYERPDEREWGFGAEFSEDGRFLLIDVTPSAAGENGLFYRELAAGEAAAGSGPVVELFAGFDARYRFLGNDGRVFYIETDQGAPNGRVVAVDLDRPAPGHWRTVVAESDDKLQGASLFGNKVVAHFLTDASSRVALYGLTSGDQTGAVELPGLGSAGGFGGKRDAAETFFTFSSFAQPTAVYRYDLATGEVAVHHAPQVGFDPDGFVVEQVFFPSRDGTRLAAFLCRKRGVGFDGTAPCLQYGYGGFNISVTPRFSPADLVWMEMGGVYAQVTLRGGGEYGEEWHEAGMRANKQNVFDDFMAASEWLVANRVTSRDRLAIEGRSNGGLLVGACLTQRPELFAAAVAGVGVMDMLRFQEFTIGWAWQDEYGFPDQREDFEVLREYSPYHNIRERAYPATLVTTGDHDDRVFPAHSFKFTAALQHAQSGGAPVLLRVDRRAGHGAGKPTSKQIDEAADVLAFLAATLGAGVPGH